MGYPALSPVENTHILFSMVRPYQVQIPLLTKLNKWNIISYEKIFRFRGTIMKNNLTKKGSGDLLPKEIANMTLKELMSNKDVEIHKKDNVLRMKRRTTSETVMVEVRSYDDASIISQSKTYRNRPFSQMETTIQQLRAEGRTQTEVADILGTTQTNISKIEKKMKKNK